MQLIDLVMEQEMKIQNKNEIIKIQKLLNYLLEYNDIHILIDLNKQKMMHFLFYYFYQEDKLNILFIMILKNLFLKIKKKLL